jgi:transcriptional regulator with XRE-family HTH domain
MTSEGIREHWRRDPEFLAAQKEIKPFFDVADDMLELRYELGLSQSQVAERMGTDQAKVSRVEAGLANPTLRFLQRLARVLDAELSVHLIRRVDLPESDTLQTYLSRGEGARVDVTATWPGRTSAEARYSVASSTSVPFGERVVA